MSVLTYCAHTGMLTKQKIINSWGNEEVYDFRP